MTDDEFEDYVRARYDRLCRVAFVLCGDRQHAQDLVQTALAKAYQPARRAKVGNLDAYVHRTIYTTHASWWRRRWRGEVPTADVPDHAAADTWDDVGIRATVLAVLARLPVEQRAVLALRFLEDLSEEETARVLGCAPGTVKSRTSRGLAALRATGLLGEPETADRGGMP